MRDAVHKLINIGLTEYEARAYNALLHQNLLTAREISELGGIPQGRVYNVLEHLIKKGFCAMAPGVVKKFKAVNPEIAIGCLIEQRQVKENEMRETAKFLQELFDDQMDNMSPLDYIHIYTTRSGQREKTFELTNNAKRIIRSFHKPPFLKSSPVNNPKVTKRVAAQVERGVIWRAIWEIDEEDPEEHVDYINGFVQQGEEVRMSEKLPLKMIISDDSSAIFTMYNRGIQEYNLTTMAVEHTYLTDALIELFEMYWEKSTPFDEYVAKCNLQEVIKCGAST